MSYSKQQLYALGEPLGDSVTRKEAGITIYGSGGGSSGGTSTSTTQASIAPEFKPLANLYTQQATNIANTPFQAYTGDRYADPNSTQNAAIGGITNRALGGDATINTGANYLQGLMNSSAQSAVNPYASQNNPYLDAMVNKAQQSVLGNAAGASMRSGAFGNSGINEAAINGLGDVATNMYGNAYRDTAQLAEQGAARQDAMVNALRSGQLNAAQLGLNYGNQAYTDMGQLLNAGNFQQQQAQSDKDFAYNQFQEAQNYPFKQLAATGNVVQQGTGSTTTGTTSGGGK